MILNAIDSHRRLVQLRQYLVYFNEHVVTSIMKKNNLSRLIYFITFFSIFVNALHPMIFHYIEKYIEFQVKMQLSILSGEELIYPHPQLHGRKFLVLAYLKRDVAYYIDISSYHSERCLKARISVPKKRKTTDDERMKL